MDSASTWQHWAQVWYVVGRSDQLAKGDVLSGHLGGHAFVVYRTDSGAIQAIDAFCSHMGAHLRTAKVVGNALQCGLHGCLIEPTHHTHIQPIEHIQTGCRIPTRAWLCQERFGLIWLYPPSEQPAPPLPFQAFHETDFIYGNIGGLTIQADWRAMICNGFDLGHMITVHQRQVVGEPIFSDLAEGGIRMDYETRVLAKGGWSSAVMEYLSGGRIVLSHLCCGSTILVHSRVGKFETVGIFSALPQDLPQTPPEQRHTRAFAAIAIPKTAKWRTIQLWAARALYFAFLRKDFTVVEHMRMKLDGVDDVGVRAVLAYQSRLSAIKGAEYVEKM